MAPLMLLLFLLSEAASQSDPTVVRVLPRDHAILSCQADDSSIKAVKWRRPDLKPDTVLLYSDGHLNTDDQHPSFKGRVELVNRDLKDRDASLILKNVTINDTGTYECRVITGDTTLIKTFRTVHLQVPGSEDGNSSPVGLYLGLAAGVLVLVAAAVVGVLIYTKQRHKDKRSDLIEVRPGQDVILPCQAADPSIRAVQWRRPDLEPDTVLSYRDKCLLPTYLHPSYKEDKVELVDRDLKKRNMSLILRDVSTNDQGTYECRVTSGGSRWKNIPFPYSEPIRTIRTIRLQVTEPADVIVVTVCPGDDVILPCRAADSSTKAVQWSRPDLKPDIIILYSDAHLKSTYQHTSFKDRVDLVDRDLKDGDVSLILKNVSSIDNGTYECRVIAAGSEDDSASFTSEPIRIIRLQVTEPDMIVVTVHPGDDVILPCRADDSSTKAVQWSRPDLKPDIIILYSDAHLKSTYQHTSFKDRVDLVERDLKDKDVSLILKNVSRHDAGTYECRVRAAGSEDDSASFTSEPIRTIRLQVTEPADLIEVTVDPGDDVILPCPTADSSIKAVQWSRPDLEPDIIILYSDGHLKSTYQHTSFKDRVDLVERDLKDGDMSLILKNVSSIDAGTYECRVRAAGSEGDSACFTSEPIRIIRLHVTEPAGPPRKETPLL